MNTRGRVEAMHHYQGFTLCVMCIKKPFNRNGPV
jgi:hypothetical protein